MTALITTTSVVGLPTSGDFLAKSVALLAVHGSLWERARK